MGTEPGLWRAGQWPGIEAWTEGMRARLRWMLTRIGLMHLKVADLERPFIFLATWSIGTGFKNCCHWVLLLPWARRKFATSARVFEVRPRHPGDPYNATHEL